MLAMKAPATSLHIASAGGGYPELPAQRIADKVAISSAPVALPVGV
jgi:hypothetical protein